VRTEISSFYRLSQKYQTNRNNKWSLYAVMMVQVRVGDEGPGVAGSDLMNFQTPPWHRLPSRGPYQTERFVSTVQLDQPHGPSTHSPATANTQSLKISLNNPQYA